MGKSVDFYFDIGSPYAYLAHTQMPALAEKTGATVIYRPILLGGVFKATGNSSPIDIPAKADYLAQFDLPRHAERYGVVLRTHPNFPFNTLALMRGAVAAEEEGCADIFIDTLFNAMWVEMRDMHDAAEIADALTKAGLDADALFARAQEQAIKDRLRAGTDAAIARGLFGAPTFFVGDALFFGQDRLDFVADALKD